MSGRTQLLVRALGPCLSLALVSSLCACSLFASSKSASAAGSADATSVRLTTTELTVESKTHTNSGKVFSMMVRSVPEKIADTKSETYEEAARMLGDPRDEAVVLAQPIFPGRTTKARLEQDAGNRLILYFLFTEPGDFWRVQIAGSPPAEVRVELGENGVERYQVER
jgi:hypothetical protein